MDTTESFNNSLPSTLPSSYQIRSTAKEVFREKFPSHLIVLVVVSYVIGAIGNFLALIILAKKKNSKNSKYTFMLRCLATNNLIGLMGMLISVTLKLLLPFTIRETYKRWFCIVRVIWRFFGLSSGCIAAVMAAERWMALARPFIYHKHITFNVVRTTIIYLICIAAFVTFLPFLGFGVYYDSVKNICLRYRNTTDALNISYAYVFMVFGTLLCAVIVCCNLFVTRVLYLIGRSKTRRKAQCYDFPSGEKGSLFHQNSYPPTTSSDEIRFAKLMTFLSISFVVCWMPQMISIPLALSANPPPKDHWFFKAADILMAFHFTLDPYIYVLTRTKHKFVSNCVKRLRKSSSFNRSQSVLRPTMEQTLDYGLNNMT